MIELIIPRKTNSEFLRMNEINDYCTSMFGKADYGTTWALGFTDHTSDNWVSFKFYDNSLATFVKLMYPDMLSREEFEDQQWRVL